MLSHTMTNNHHPLLSLYENPLAAGAVAGEGQVAAAGDDRLVSYLIRGAKAESTAELAPVASLPSLPPRSCVEFAAVASIPALPPRA
jgi:hypothetical protein